MVAHLPGASTSQSIDSWSQPKQTSSLVVWNPLTIRFATRFRVRSHCKVGNEIGQSVAFRPYGKSQQYLFSCLGSEKFDQLRDCQNLVLLGSQCSRNCLRCVYRILVTSRLWLPAFILVGEQQILGEWTHDWLSFHRRSKFLSTTVKKNCNQDDGVPAALSCCHWPASYISVCEDWLGLQVLCVSFVNLVVPVQSCWPLFK